MCDILVDEMGRAPPHRHRASVSHRLQLLSQQGSPGGGKQEVRLFRVNVKTKLHTEFHEHLLSAVHKNNGEPGIFFVIVDGYFLKYLHAGKKNTLRMQLNLKVKQLPIIKRLRVLILGPKETACREKPKLTCLHSLQNITFQ